MFCSFLFCNKMIIRGFCVCVVHVRKIMAVHCLLFIHSKNWLKHRDTHTSMCNINHDIHYTSLKSFPSFRQSLAVERKYIRHVYWYPCNPPDNSKTQRHRHLAQCFLHPRDIVQIGIAKSLGHGLETCSNGARVWSRVPRSIRADATGTLDLAHGGASTTHTTT